MGIAIRLKGNRNLTLSIGFVLLVTFLPFLPSLQNGFVNRDDNSYVTENDLITEFSWENLKTIFSTPFMGHYHPLTLLSYLLEYSFFHLHPFIYHLTNLIIHLCNTLLVFWLVFLFTKNLLTSLIVALFFGFHPMRVESVVWISERKDVLYAFFFLGAMISYTYYDRERKIKYYYLTLLLYLLSLLSKVMAIPLPLVMLLLDYAFGRKFEKHLLIEKIPFFVVAFGFGILALSIPGAIRGSRSASPLSLIDKISIYWKIIIFYLTKLLYPTRLSCLYPSVGELVTPWPHLFLYSPIMVGFILVYFIFTKRIREILFGLIFFLVTLAPALPLRIVADRYTYIPYLGLFLLFGEFLSWLFYQSQRKLRWVRPILFMILFGIVGILFFLTWERGRVWKDSVTLWDDVIKNYPGISKAYASRGEAYSEMGEYDQAILNYNKALEINPRFAEAYYDRGNAYNRKGHLDQAILDYTKAIEFRPNYAEAYYNRGNAYAKKDQWDQAIIDYNKAIEINENYVEAYVNRGSIYSMKQQFDQAISNFDRAIEINPKYAIAHFNKALVCETVGRPWDAVKAYKDFIENAEPHQSLQIEIAREKIKQLSLGSYESRDNPLKVWK